MEREGRDIIGLVIKSIDQHCSQSQTFNILNIRIDKYFRLHGQILMVSQNIDQ